METKKIKKIFRIERVRFLNENGTIARVKLFNQTLFSFRLSSKKAKLVF